MQKGARDLRRSLGQWRPHKWGLGIRWRGRLVSGRWREIEMRIEKINQIFVGIDIKKCRLSGKEKNVEIALKSAPLS